MQKLLFLLCTDLQSLCFGFGQQTCLGLVHPVKEKWDVVGEILFGRDRVADGLIYAAHVSPLHEELCVRGVAPVLVLAFAFGSLVLLQKAGSLVWVNHRHNLGDVHKTMLHDLDERINIILRHFKFLSCLWLSFCWLLADLFVLVPVYLLAVYGAIGHRPADRALLKMLNSFGAHSALHITLICGN